MRVRWLRTISVVVLIANNIVAPVLGRDADPSSLAASAARSTAAAAQNGDEDGRSRSPELVPKRMRVLAEGEPTPAPVPEAPETDSLVTVAPDTALPEETLTPAVEDTTLPETPSPTEGDTEPDTEAPEVPETDAPVSVCRYCPVLIVKVCSLAR